MSGYLRGREAVEVARETGLPLNHARAPINEEADIDWQVAFDTVRRGVWRPDDVILDLTRLSWIDKARVALVRIGLYMESLCNSQSVPC